MEETSKILVSEKTWFFKVCKWYEKSGAVKPTAYARSHPERQLSPEPAHTVNAGLLSHGLIVDK